MKKIFSLCLLFTSLYCFSMNCEGDIIAPDAKIVPLSTAVLNKPYMELYAVDFSVQSSDNCTGYNDLKYTFFNARPINSKINTVHYFKGNGLEATQEEFNLGIAQQWLPNFKTSLIRIFKCHFELPINIEINVLDEQNNAGSGICKLTIVDPQNLSGPCNEIIVNVADFKGIGLNGIKAKITSVSNNIENTYNFDKILRIPYDTSLICLTIESATQLPITGISTNDIKLTRNHILGIKKFTSPLSVIASDLNKDAKVTATDLNLFKKYYFGLATSPGDSWIYFPINDNDFCGKVDINKSLIFEVTGISLGKVSLLEGQ